MDIFGCNKKLKRLDKEHFGGAFKKKNNVWIDCPRPTNSDEKFVREFINLHPITTEDIQEHHTRIKYEEFDGYSFIVYSGVAKLHKNTIENYHISMILGPHFLITFHNRPVPTLQNLKKNPERLERLLRKGPDHLLHHILDTEVDLYFPMVDKMYDDIEIMDEKFVREPSDILLDHIFDKKRLTLRLKRLIVPLGDIFLRLSKTKNDHLSKEVSIYFRDVFDHVVRINETLQNCKEQISDTLGEHQSNMSNKMNETMKVLTIIATIMLPLTLLSGIYGMNITLPFQRSTNAFNIITAIMVAIALVMLIYFKRKKWI